MQLAAFDSPAQPPQNAPAARALASGALGARILRLAQAAAALHAAQHAQDLRARPETGAGPAEARP